METCCGYGYDPARKSHTLTRIFKGQKKRTGHHKTAMLYGNNIRISARSDSTEFVPNKKRELFPGLLPASPGSFALPHLMPKHRSPRPGSGILTRFPFDRRRHNNNSAPFRTGFPYLLGSTDPCSTAVHMEPFSTSVFKVLI